MYAHTTANISTGGGGVPFAPETVVFNANGNYNMPAKLLSYFTVTATGALAALKIGTTPGGGEVLDSEAIGAGQTETYNYGYRFPAAAVLYITGITSQATISFYNL